MVALAGGLPILPPHRLPGESLDVVERLEDRAGVRPAPAEVVDLARPRIPEDRLDGAGHVVAMDVVPDLLALVPVDPVGPPLELRLDQVREEPVQLDARVIRAGQAPAPQAGGLHPEVPPVFLDHD